MNQFPSSAVEGHVLHRLTWSLVLSLSLLVPGCRDDSEPPYGQEYDSIPEASAEHTLAREMCYLMVEGCGCPEIPFFSMTLCTNALTDELAAEFADAQAAGLEYQPECMAEHVNLYTQQIGCATLTELSNTTVLQELSVPSCKVHAGTVQEGEPCTQYPNALGDDCAPGLRCAGTCFAVPETTPRLEGESCGEPGDLCEPGTACQGVPDDPTMVRCTRLPGEGEPCSFGCDIGLSCELPDGGSEDVCVAPPAVGEPCGSFPDECAAGGYCDAGMCVPTFAEGSPCFRDEECGAGFICDEIDDDGEDVCQPERAYLCL